MRRLRNALLAALALAGGVGVPAARALGAEPSLMLRAGQARFWDGAYIDSGDIQDDSMCNVAAPCPTWPLRVADRAARLRVALDTPSREDTFGLELIDPSGAVVASSSNSNQFDTETFALTPAVGTWTVRVVPQGVDKAAFRLRAKLEREIPSRPTGKVALLPDLKAVPPFEFGFTAPANPLNGAYPPDTVNPPLDVLGYHPVSCAPDETAPVALGGGGATRCLRFTSGPMNVGVGPFDMRFDLVGDGAKGQVEPNTIRGPMFQAVHYGDHSTTLRPAGTYSFHKTHAHFHTDQILSYELFAVDAPGALRPAGVGTKSGFCPADQLFGQWTRFSQEIPGVAGDSAGSGCFSPYQGSLGLTPGWGDVYRWQRPGQYVEFAGNGDGQYVVRVTVDKSNHVLESDDSNNASYALIDVTGDRVRLLERGQGTDPWDPKHVAFRGDGPASVEPIGNMPPR